MNRMAILVNDVHQGVCENTTSDGEEKHKEVRLHHSELELDGMREEEDQKRMRMERSDVSEYRRRL